MTVNDVVVKNCMKMFRATLIRQNSLRLSAYTIEIHIRRTCFKIIKLHGKDVKVCSKFRKVGK